MEDEKATKAIKLNAPLHWTLLGEEKSVLFREFRFNLFFEGRRLIQASNGKIAGFDFDDTLVKRGRNAEMFEGIIERLEELVSCCL